MFAPLNNTSSTTPGATILIPIFVSSSALQEFQFSLKNPYSSPLFKLRKITFSYSKTTDICPPITMIYTIKKM